MPSSRLLLVAALTASVAAPALAQTAPDPSAAPVGAPSAVGPAAPPPVEGPTDAPSATTAPATGAGGMTGSAPMPAPSVGTGAAGGTAATAPAPFTPLAPAPGANIVAVLQASGQFTTLVKALAATNLTGVLQTHGPLTVFAPSDAAFAALPPGALAGLMQPANLPRLQRLLTYHVVNAKVSSSQFVGHAAGKVSTVAGVKVTLDGATPPLKVNDATVVQPDVKASNGTIFVIDKVLTPPAG